MSPFSGKDICKVTIITEMQSLILRFRVRQGDSHIPGLISSVFACDLTTVLQIPSDTNTGRAGCCAVSAEKVCKLYLKMRRQHELRDIIVILL